MPRSGAGGNASAGSGSPAAPVVFSARVNGGSVLLDVENPLAAFYWSCTDAVALQKLDVATGTWMKPIDERPPPHDPPGYYLDGRFVPATSVGEGCDIVSCQNFGSTNFVAKAVEYVQVGSVEVFYQGMPVYVPSIESRPLSGSARVVVQYALHDPMCGGHTRAEVGLTLPRSEGICCPVGNEGCGSAGPAGGWALDFDSCRPFWPMADAYHVRSVDSHGCPYLAEDTNQCCGCADAGVEE